MLNVYDYIEDTRLFKTFKVNDLLFVEYRCLFKDLRIPYWTHNNYFTFVLHGDSKYSNGNKEYVLHKGDALFVRRGAYVSHGHGKEAYCALLIFVSDDFIKTVLDKYPMPQMPKANASTEGGDAIIRLQMDESLTAYFHSVLSYFPKDISPSPELLKIKFEELLLSIMTGNRNGSLATCLREIHQSGKISLRHVMETSFMYSMGLDEYARLCGRSLSVFKTEFFETFKTTPGRWLINARVQYARILLETTNESINEVAFKSGFKNTTHFVKVFKIAYGVPPLQYRLRVNQSVGVDG